MNANINKKNPPQKGKQKYFAGVRAWSEKYLFTARLRAYGCNK